MTVAELIVILQKLPQDVKVVTSSYPDAESSVAFADEVYGADYYVNGLWDTEGVTVVKIG